MLTDDTNNVFVSFSYFITYSGYRRLRLTLKYTDRPISSQKCTIMYIIWIENNGCQTFNFVNDMVIECILLHC